MKLFLTGFLPFLCCFYQTSIVASKNRKASKNGYEHTTRLKGKGLRKYNFRGDVLMLIREQAVDRHRVDKMR